jgi:hypothetical protein
MELPPFIIVVEALAITKIIVGTASHRDSTVPEDIIAANGSVDNEQM